MGSLSNLAKTRLTNAFLAIDDRVAPLIIGQCVLARWIALRFQAVTVMLLCSAQALGESARYRVSRQLLPIEH